MHTSGRADCPAQEMDFGPAEGAVPGFQQIRLIEGLYLKPGFSALGGESGECQLAERLYPENCSNRELHLCHLN